MNKVDPTGQIWDTIADAIFIAGDLVSLGWDEATNGGQNRGENLAALAADSVAVVVPFVTGAGVAARIGNGANKTLTPAAKAGADFITNSKGVTAHASPGSIRKSLDEAGFVGTPSKNRDGTIHTGLPGKDGPMDVRVMDGKPNAGPYSGPRAVTSRSGSPNGNDKVRTDGSKFRNNEPKDQREAESHIHLPW